jgi:hypothetical protein
VVGLILLGAAINQWRLADFDPLNYAHEMRLEMPGATLVALGFQTILSKTGRSFDARFDPASIHQELSCFWDLRDRAVARRSLEQRHGKLIAWRLLTSRAASSKISSRETA